MELRKLQYSVCVSNRDKKFVSTKIEWKYEKVWNGIYDELNNKQKLK